MWQVAEEVELRLNGRSLGVKKNSSDPKSRDKIRWDGIAYEPGTLLAIARNSGKEVARHEITTAGPLKRLALIPDNETWKADGQDLMHIRVLGLDAKGRRTPLANDTLTVRVSGPAELVATDNGDIAGNHQSLSGQPARHPSRGYQAGQGAHGTGRQGGTRERKMHGGNETMNNV